MESKINKKFSVENSSGEILTVGAETNFGEINFIGISLDGERVACYFDSAEKDVEVYHYIDDVHLKALDKEDIESLGWRQTAISKNIFYLKQNDDYFLRKDTAIEHRFNIVNGENMDKFWFDGIIKNKSELKKIMEQISIEVKQETVVTS